MCVPAKLKLNLGVILKKALCGKMKGGRRKLQGQTERSGAGKLSCNRGTSAGGNKSSFFLVDLRRQGGALAANFKKKKKKKKQRGERAESRAVFGEQKLW